MRSLPELQRFGFVAKTHGYKGQVKLVLETEITQLEWDWLFVEIDKKPVPFFVETISEKGADLLVKLKGLHSDQDASKICGKAVLLPLAFFPEQESIPLVEQFDLIDTDGQFIGKVRQLIPGALQDMLVADINGEEVLIPWHEAFIMKLDENNRCITVSIPDDLLGLNR